MTKKLSQSSALAALTSPSMLTSTPTSYLHTIHIDDAIVEASEYRDIIMMLRNASPADTVHMLIDSPGGSLNTTASILAAMAHCEAHIITEAVCQVASAATLIFLAGNELRINENIEFMIHTASYGSYGKANNVREHVMFLDDRIARTMQMYYKHFLSEDEIASVLTGGDIYLSTEEVKERLDHKISALTKEAENQVQEDLNEAVEEATAMSKEEQDFYNI